MWVCGCGCVGVCVFVCGGGCVCVGGYVGGCVGVGGWVSGWVGVWRRGQILLYRASQVAYLETTTTILLVVYSLVWWLCKHAVCK